MSGYTEFISLYLPRGKINEHPQLIIKSDKWISNHILSWRKLCLSLEVSVNQLLTNWFLHMNIMKHVFNDQHILELLSFIRLVQTQLQFWTMNFINTSEWKNNWLFVAMLSVLKKVLMKARRPQCTEFVKQNKPKCHPKSLIIMSIMWRNELYFQKVLLFPWYVINF